MIHRSFRGKAKRAVSLLAAASVAAVQLVPAFSVSAAAVADNTAGIVPRNTFWWGDPVPEKEPEVIYGDVNGDKNVDGTDAALIEKYVSGIQTDGVDVKAADVNLDGNVTLYDADLVLQQQDALSAGINGGKGILPYEGPVIWKFYPDAANYEVINKGMTCQEAEDYCESRGGHLVTISNEKEQAQVQALIAAQGSNRKNNYWTGLKRLNDTEFGWLTCEEFNYTNWNPENPNNLDGKQDSVLLYGNSYGSSDNIGTWDDINNSGTYNNQVFYGLDNFGFICEYDEYILQERQEWTDPASFPSSGVYKLTCDVTATYTDVSDFLDIDLNGHKVIISKIDVNGRMNVRDSSAEKTGSVSASSYGTLLDVNGKLKIYGGTFYGNNQGNDAATIGVNGSGRFDLYDGIVTAYYSNPLSLRNSFGVTNLMGGALMNTSRHTTTDQSVGSAIWLNVEYSGILNITGTDVISDISSAIYGTGSKGTINISGGSVNGEGGYGINCTGGSAVNLSGNVSVKGRDGGIYIPDGKKINITDRVTAADLSIYAQSSGTFTNGLSNYHSAGEIAPYIAGIKANGRISIDENGELSITVINDLVKTPVDKTQRYQIFNDGLPWEEANTFCELNGGHLVTITSQEEQDQINALIDALTDARKNYWAGAKRNNASDFQWVTDEKFSYSNWNTGEPNSGMAEPGLMLYGKNGLGPTGTWNDLSFDCSGNPNEYFTTANFGFICEWEKLDPPATTTAPPETATTTTTSTTTTTTTNASTTTTASTTAPMVTTTGRFVVIDDGLTWNEAASACMNMGGHLAVITTQEEQDEAIAAIMASGTDKDYLWLGGMLDTPTSYCWITNEPMTYTKWARNQPDFASGDECMMINVKNGTWEDVPLFGVNNDYDTMGYLCEFEPASQDTRLNIDGKIKVKRMTIEDIHRAGIDLGDDENYNSFDYSIKAEFGPSGVVFDNYVTVDLSGHRIGQTSAVTITDPATGAEIITELENNTPTYVAPLNAFVVHIVTDRVEEEMYMIIYGNCKWLKEFFDIQLIVINNETSRSLNECSAHLILPQGLSLPEGDYTHILGNIPPQNSKDTHWYVRGDEEGIYTGIKAIVKGLNGNVPIDPPYEFTTENPLHVYGSSALEMYVELPRYSYFNEKYPIKIILKNVSNFPIYNLENIVTDFREKSYTVFKRTKDGVTRTLDERSDWLEISHNVGAIRVDELKPGEEATIELLVPDLWKSVYEQYIDAEIYDANMARLTAALSLNPDLMHINAINSMYIRYLSSLPTEHILKRNVRIGLQGSNSDIKTKVKYINNRPPHAPVEFVCDTEAYNSLEEVYMGRNNISTYRDQYIYNLDTSQAREYNSDFFNYLNNIFCGRGITRILNIARPMLMVVEPDDDIIVKVYVRMPNGRIRRPAPGNTDAEPSSDFELSDAFTIETNGEAEYDEDGKLIVSGETVLKLNAVKSGEFGELCVEYPDGTIDTYNLRSADEKTDDTEESIYRLIQAPENGNAGYAVSVDSSTHEISDCISINPAATAMLSNKKTYADIRVAVEEAVKEGKKTELSLFGNITVTADVTIPDYISVLIAPGTVIKLSDGCKLIAEGEVNDFSGFSYDLSGKGPFTPSAATTTTVTTSAVTTTSTTTAVTSETSANTTTATTEGADDKNIASDDVLAEWAVTDYQLKNIGTVADTDVTVTSDGQRTIILKDKDGKVLDTYTIDPVTGSGTNSANEAVDLPQTGNRSLTDIMIAASALIMLICGLAAVMMSEIPGRNRRNEE